MFENDINFILLLISLLVISNKYELTKFFDIFSFMSSNSLYAVFSSKNNIVSLLLYVTFLDKSFFDNGLWSVNITFVNL